MKEIWKRFQKTDVTIKLLWFAYLVKEILFVVFFEKKTIDEDSIKII